MNVLVVDDEPMARRVLMRFLREDPEVTALQESASGEDARALLGRGDVDVVFMDVSMPGIDGFEALAGHTSESPLAVVFCTAFEQHALQAHEAGAAAYLLKPFDRERFVAAFARAKTRLRQETLYRKSEELSRLLGGAAGSPAAGSTAAGFPAAEAATGAADRLLIESPAGTELIATDEILWIEAADKLVRIHAQGTTYSVRRTLAELESQLDPRSFMRVHRCNVVRLDRVRALRRTEGGATYLELDGGTRVVVSRSRVRAVRAALG